MKTSAKYFIALLIVGVIGLLAFNCSAQSYREVSGKVVIIQKPKTAAKPDSVVAVVGTVKYYRGSKGGVYCLKKSKKTGKTYKSYLIKKD